MIPATQFTYALGFDASCELCTSVADEVAETAGYTLNVVPLSHPWFDHARNQFIPKDSWEPTLLEMNYDGTPVGAWYGPSLPGKLLRVLGPRKSLRILADLGRMRQDSTHRTQSRISRSTFIRVGAGALFVAALASRSGSPALAQNAQAVLSKPRSASVDEVKEVFDHPDLIALIGASSAATAAKQAVDKPDSVFRAKVEDPVDGIVTKWIVRSDENHFVVLSTYAQPSDGLKTDGELLYIDAPAERAEILAHSFNGEVGDPLPSSLTPEKAAAKCSSCSAKSSVKRIKKCKGDVWACVASAYGCAGCAGACGSGIGPICVACLVAICGNAYRACCKKTEGSYCIQCK